MLQATNTDLLVSKAHIISECQNLLFPLQIMPVKVKLIGGFLFFCTLGNNGLPRAGLALKKCQLAHPKSLKEAPTHAPTN